MELTVQNSHVLYKAVTKNEKMKLYDFQMDIIQRLCHADPFVQNDCTDSYENDHPPSKAPQHDPISRLSSGFKSHHIVSFIHCKKYPQRKCRLCKKNGARKDTRYYCKECNIPLCKAPCFGDYHSKKMFSA